MKLRILLLLLGPCIVAFTSSLYAGVEPSPFQPEINQLGAVTNSLNSCLDRVQKIISFPPNPVLSSPDLNGAINRLEAIDGQGNSLNDFVANTILSVMGVEPSPFKADLIPALESAGSISQAIVDVIVDFFEHPPEPGYEAPESFRVALENVMFSAIDLTETIENGIIQLRSGECVISGYDEFACMENVTCSWVSDIPGSVPFCCCSIILN